VCSFLRIRVFCIARVFHLINPAAPVPGSREHPLVMVDSEKGPFCPRFPKKRAGHIDLRFKDLGVTVWLDMTEHCCPFGDWGLLMRSNMELFVILCEC